MRPLFCFFFFSFFLVFQLAVGEFQFELKKNDSGGGTDLIDELNNLKSQGFNGNSTFTEVDQKRRFGEMDLEPPNTFSKISNLFYGKMLFLMETNMEHDIAVIAKYTNPSTQILLCEHSQKSTFAELRRFIRLLHMYFKSVKQDGFSMQPDTDQKTVKFQMKYKATTVVNTEVRLEWHGEAFFDTNLKYFIYSTLDLKGDCTTIPNEIPEHPIEPKENYINRLKSNLTGILFNNQKHPQHTYQAFIQQFLIKKTRVQFCERNGETAGMGELSDYLFKRYADVQTFTDHDFTTTPFSDYQTDAIFTVIATWQNGMIMKDRYRFRVEEERERDGDQGWKDWWSTWVFVECPANLTPQTDPEVLKKVFISQVCGSIPAMIQNGPSTQSQVTFLSHFMKREDQGFHAQICEDNYKPIYKFAEFEKWLYTWTKEYDGARLSESKVESFENFSFICIVELMKNYGDHDKEWKKREFKMKAFYEIDRWLVKETKIGCDHF